MRWRENTLWYHLFYLIWEKNPPPPLIPPSSSSSISNLDLWLVLCFYLIWRAYPSMCYDPSTLPPVREVFSTIVYRGNVSVFMGMSISSTLTQVFRNSNFVCSLSLRIFSWSSTSRIELVSSSNSFRYGTLDESLGVSF